MFISLGLFLRPYQDGTRFTIQTYYHSFKYSLNPNDSTFGLVRWRLRLFKFQFGAFHLAGMKLYAADALSLLRILNGGSTPFDDDLKLFAIDAQGKRASQIFVFNTNNDYFVPREAQPRSFLKYAFKRIINHSRASIVYLLQSCLTLFRSKEFQVAPR